jgi:hypothetical protein
MKTDGRLGFSCRSYLSWFCPEHRPFPPIHNISYRHIISDTLINLTYVAKSFPTTHFGLHVSYLLRSVGKVSRIPTPGDPKLAPFVTTFGPTGFMFSCCIYLRLEIATPNPNPSFWLESDFLYNHFLFRTYFLLYLSILFSMTYCICSNFL